MMNINTEELIAFRRDLHKHPELSGMEEKTAEKIYTFLIDQQPSHIIKNIGGYGIIATWEGKEAGKHIMIRADFDALPIFEINDFSHRSVQENVSHKCGHDGHATILCGVAAQLHKKGLESGKVSLLFQPAEETGEGAKAMLADKHFPKDKYDFVFALHNLPGLPLHEIIVKERSFTPSVTSIIISLKGKTSHAAEPEHGTNPCLAIADIMQKVMKLQYNFPAEDDMIVIAPVHIEAGEKAYGVSAGAGSVHFTIRCWTQNKLESLQANIEEISRRVAERYQLEISFEYTDSFVANFNNSRALSFVKEAALQKELSLTEIKTGFKWGEDFGLFSHKYRGCMFGIGSGENCPALHNPDYDFPDEVIDTGVKIFFGIIEESLKS